MYIVDVSDHRATPSFEFPLLSSYLISPSPPLPPSSLPFLSASRPKHGGRGAQRRHSKRVKQERRQPRRGGGGGKERTIRGGATAKEVVPNKGGEGKREDLSRGGRQRGTHLSMGKKRKKKKHSVCVNVCIYVHVNE